MLLRRESGSLVVWPAPLWWENKEFPGVKVTMIFLEKMDQAVAKEMMEISYNEKGEEGKSKMMTSFSSQQKTLKDDFLHVEFSAFISRERQ